MKNSYFLDFSDTPPSRRIRFWDWFAGTLILGGLLFVSLYLLIPIYGVLPIEWQLDVNPDFPRSGYGETLFLWLTFVPAFIAPFLIYKYYHRLPLKRLLTAARRFQWGRLFTALMVIMIVYGGATLIEYGVFSSEFDDVTLHPDWSGFGILLLMTLIFLPIQSASEEILCRGYLNQGLSLITRNPWIAFVMTSGFFALLHLGNPEAEGQVWPYMIGTFIFGMAMCWLSYEDQGLESAIGAHIGNNLFIFVIFGYADPTLPQSAIWMGPEPVIDWKDTLESAAYIFGTTYAIIRINRWRTQRRKTLQANA